MAGTEVRRQQFSSARHSTSYLAAGPEDGPLVICVHGWPELSISWRGQLPFLAGLGYRAIAPDMRGYGESSVYDEHGEYRLEEVVQDMLELLEHLQADSAIWVGHDWGTPVVWSMASHHPERCLGVVGLCVPYATLERGLDGLMDLVDRKVYPESEFPAGQWEYMRFYEESFAAATGPMDANPRTFCQAIFRKGDPVGRGEPSGTAMVRKTGGWLGGLPEAPEIPRDDDVVSEEELQQYVASLKRNGFFAANSWYKNHKANAEFSKLAQNDGKLTMPVLFMHARYDYTCETLDSNLAVPMRGLCSNLSEVIVDSGHWMAQERPADVNKAMVKWLLEQFPESLA